MANPAHKETFKSILELYGLSSVIAEAIAKPLAQIDNNQQDQLIQQLIYHYVEKTKAQIR